MRIGIFHSERAHPLCVHVELLHFERLQHAEPDAEPLQLGIRFIQRLRVVIDEFNS